MKVTLGEPPKIKQLIREETALIMWKIFKNNKSTSAVSIIIVFI